MRACAREGRGCAGDWKRTPAGQTRRRASPELQTARRVFRGRRSRRGRTPARPGDRMHTQRGGGVGHQRNLTKWRVYLSTRRVPFVGCVLVARRGRPRVLRTCRVLILEYGGVYLRTRYRKRSVIFLEIRVLLGFELTRLRLTGRTRGVSRPGTIVGIDFRRGRGADGSGGAEGFTPPMDGVELRGLPGLETPRARLPGNSSPSRPARQLASTSLRPGKETETERHRAGWRLSATRHTTASPGSRT